MSLDAAYTAADHELRKDDPYARAKYDITLRWLKGRSPGSVLYHIGCGSGLFNHLAVAAGCRVRAFEPDARAFAMAASSLPADRCELFPLALEAVPGKGVADVVVMHDVLEHIEDEQAAVEALRRIVRDDGRVVVSVPAMPSLFGRHDRALGHFRRYTRRSLRRALAPSFEVTRMRAFGASFVPFTLVWSRWLDRPYPTGGLGERPSLPARAFAALCALERRVPAPLGTSLVCEAVPRYPGA